MRALILALATTMLSAQATQQQVDTGRIQLRVNHAGSGEPLSGARVLLQQANYPPALATIFASLPLGFDLPFRGAGCGGECGEIQAPPVPWQMLSGLTDNEGRLAFERIPAGQYVMVVERTGFFGVHGTQVGSPVTVVPSRPTPEVSISLMPAGVVTGTIRDPDGNPLPGVVVAAFRWQYDLFNGRAILMANGGQPTNDRGQYRLFALRPGEYLIGITPRRPTEAPSKQDSYARTFFPGTVDPDSAQPILVKAGSETNIDINVQAPPTFKISGQMLNSVSMAGSTATKLPSLYLVPRGPNGFLDNTEPRIPNRASDQTNGRFEIQNVRPGSYELIAMVQDSMGRSVPGRTLIEVGNEDVAGVVVNLRPGVEVRARVIYTDGSKPVGVPEPQLQIWAKEDYPQPFNAAMQIARVTPSISLAGGMTVSADSSGTFIFSSVAEARYGFSVVGLPRNAYVADIRSGGASVQDTGLIVGNSTPPAVDVLVSLSGATIEGTVVDTMQRPAIGMGARVALVPEESRRSNRLLFKDITPSLSGRFTIDGVPPGNYKVFAWEAPPEGSPYLNPDFVSHYESQGQRVTVTARERVPNLQVRVIPRESTVRYGSR